MEKRLVSFVIFISITLLLVSTPMVCAQTYSGFSKFVDNIKLVFSSGEGKVKLALEIREKELNSAIENAKIGNNEVAIKNLESAKNKLQIVREGISPVVASEVRSSVENAENIINNNKNANTKTAQYFNDYLKEEEKTKLSVNLSEKVFDYCRELALQNYDLMINDEKCKSYSWMVSIVKEKIEAEKAGDLEKIKVEMFNCMNNPKDCNCDKISSASGKANCEKYKASSVRCEFQGDSSACKDIEDIKREDIKEDTRISREELEKEIMEKYIPAECSEAGIRDGEQCKKLILTLNQPKSECLEKGIYIGEEKCKEKLVKEGNVLNECIVDGKLIDSSQCLKNVKEENKPTGKAWELMSGECKERGVYDIAACDEMVNLPRPCKDAGYYTKKECEALAMNNNLPKECVDEGLLTPEACEKFKLPSDCAGAFSREECEQMRIEQKFPEDCKSAGEFDPAKCAVIIVEGEESLVVTAGAEVEYLARQGLTFEKIPGICREGINFIRSDDCDMELSKLGISLPPPTATFGIAKECMVDERTTVSPEECRGRIVKKIINDTVPKECQGANITNPEDCSSLMAEKRIEEGIGINMPQECLGVSIEDCKAIMKEKGIEIGEINKEINLPKECREMGISDVKDCDMVAGKINEERIKNGEKIVVDENGKVDYINPEQIEKIADDSEKASQEVKPDFEKSEKIMQEINNLENNMNQIEERNGQETDGDGKNVVEQQNEIKDEIKKEVSSGDSSGGNNEVSGGGSETSSNNVIESSGGNSGGGSALTGQVISDTNQKGPPANTGKILQFGPSDSDISCMMTCMKCTSPGVGCTGDSAICQAQCNVVKPEQTEEESCVETCAKKGCGEFDFSCQQKNQAVCDKECGMIKEPPAKSEEEQCIRDCVTAESPGLICKPGEGGEKGNALCQKCAKSCESLYAGPCLTEMNLEEKKQACNTCENCYGEPVMGDSGEGYDCIIDVKCADSSSEFGDNPGSGEGVESSDGQGEGVISRIGDFFRGLFGGGK